MPLSSRSRNVVRRCLLMITNLCTAFAIVSVFLTLAAGTMQVDGEYATGGPGGLLLSAISVVQFKGIVPADNSTPGAYLVTLHWFLNAFGWEYPSASWDDSCGIISNMNGLTPGGALSLPHDLVAVAQRLKLPAADYGCLSADPRTALVSGRCDNAFFAAWAASAPHRAALATSARFPADLPLWAHYLAAAALLAVFVQEAVFRWWPGALRCRCPRFMAGWCPCLKDGEEVSAAACDRLRLWMYGVTALVYAAAPLLLGLRGLTIVRHLDRVGVPGMDAHIGSGFLVLSVATFGVIVLAGACVGVMMCVGYNRSWMDEQQIVITITGPDSDGKTD